MEYSTPILQHSNNPSIHYSITPFRREALWKFKLQPETRVKLDFGFKRIFFR